MQPDFAELVRAGYDTCRERGDEDAFLDYLVSSLQLVALRMGLRSESAWAVALDLASNLMLDGDS